MKYLFILLFLVQSVQASEWDQYLSMGNKSYSEGNYEQAINYYNKILENKIESGELYYNLGNAYYKMDEIGKAIYYYEKALIFLEGDEALEQNLKIARLKIIDKIEPIPKLFIFVWLDEIMRLMTIEYWGWLTLILFFIVGLFFALYLIFSKRLLIQISWIVTFVFILTLFIFVVRIFQFESIDFGIIFDKKVSVMSEPNLGAAEVFILHEGTKVKINRQLGDWFEISIADGKTGWCKAGQVGII